MSRVFLSGALQELPETERQALVNSFKRHVAGEPTPGFGRDELYDHPHTPPLVRAEDVAHIHLEDPLTPWPPGRDPHRNTSDIHLVYCQGFRDANCYLLMAVLQPDAHAQARQFRIMAKLGVMAEEFRRRY